MTMNVKKINLFLFLMIFSLSTNVYSQNQNTNLSVLVKNEKNKPVPGAIILIDGIKQKRIANSNGSFKVKLKKVPKTITAFSPIFGIKTIKYKKNKGTITIIISPDNKISDDNSVKTKSLNPQQFSTIYDYLRGNVPGLNIQGTTITIRGFNTVNGNTSPLFILNGAEVDQQMFGQIIPLEIKSVSVLKGSETARYGVRGANGVIIVETK